MTREIPREEWMTFFDGFSRQHEGWLVTVEVLGGSGAQPEAIELPLAGIVADPNGGKQSISILVGEEVDKHVTHTISNPTDVTLDETETGAHEALRITGADGLTTLVRFRSTLLPEM